MARALNSNPFRKENVEKLVQFVSQPELHIENFFDPLFSGDPREDRLFAFRMEGQEELDVLV